MGDEQREHGEHLSSVWKLREERVERSVGCPVGFLFPNSIRRKINLFLDIFITDGADTMGYMSGT